MPSSVGIFASAGTSEPLLPVPEAPPHLWFWVDASERGSMFANTAGTRNIADSSGENVVLLKSIGSKPGVTMQRMVESSFPTENLFPEEILTWQKNAQNGRAVLYPTFGTQRGSFSGIWSQPTVALFQDLAPSGGTVFYACRSTDTYTGALFKTFNTVRNGSYLITRYVGAHFLPYHQERLFWNWGQIAPNIEVMDFNDIKIPINTNYILASRAGPVSNACEVRYKLEGQPASPVWSRKPGYDSTYFSSVRAVDTTGWNNYGELNNHVFEVRIYQGELADAEVDVIFDALVQKWGL